MAADFSGGEAPGDSPPAGWYPDPNDPASSRYWDGRRWTEFTGPRESSPPGGFPAPGSAPGPGRVEAPRRLGSIAWAAYSVLGFALLVNLAYLPISLDYADALQTQIDDRSLSLQEAYDAEDALGIVSLAYLASVIAGAIGFLVWWHRAYSNLRTLTEQPLRYGTGWSIGAWFVPIRNLWRPKQIGNDIWRGGDPNARGSGGDRALRLGRVRVGCGGVGADLRQASERPPGRDDLRAELAAGRLLESRL